MTGKPSGGKGRELLAAALLPSYGWGRKHCINRNCLRCWKEHFSELLNHPLVPENHTLTSHSFTNPDCPITPMSPAEVKAAVAKLKNGNAADLCSITAETLKAGGDNIISPSVSYNHVWVSEAL